MVTVFLFTVPNKTPNTAAISIPVSLEISVRIFLKFIKYNIIWSQIIGYITADILL